MVWCLHAVTNSTIYRGAECLFKIFMDVSLMEMFIWFTLPLPINILYWVCERQ